MFELIAWFFGFDTTESCSAENTDTWSGCSGGWQ